MDPRGGKPVTLDLTTRDRHLLSGEAGEAPRLAMRILATMAEVYGADRLLDIESAHVDGCLYHGLSGLELARRLRDAGARVAVPTTLNVGALDLMNPATHRGTKEQAEHARELMEAYQSMGCRPTWTCAPYQGEQRPAAGAQVAWAESNAIVFANSVLGARTNRYGDFIDICAAITARAPACGLHLEKNRRGRILVRLSGLPERLLREPALAPVLGYYLGGVCGSRVPVLDGLPAGTTEDFLKALGAAAASSGAVALFHVVGRTPEAPTLEAAFQGEEPERVLEVRLDELRAVLARLSTAPDGEIQVVALGSPHFSLDEFARLLPLVESWPPSEPVDLVVCTHRLVLAALDERGWSERLRSAGVGLVVDTCVVVAPILRRSSGVLMTNSGKFAHYAPPNTGLEVVYGSLEECVRSAHLGRVWRDPDLWEEKNGDRHPLLVSREPDGLAEKGACHRFSPDAGTGRLPTGRGVAGRVPVERVLVDGGGAVEGELLVLAEPLSLWGGLDARTGTIIDPRHPQLGESVADRVLALPRGRGSSSTSAILLEAVRLGTAPRALLLRETDAILALGAAVARELYDRCPTVLVLAADDFDRLRTGARVRVDGSGTVEILARSSQDQSTT